MLLLPEVRHGRSLVYQLWHESQTPNTGVVFSYTTRLQSGDRLTGMTVAEFLVAYDKGGHATRPRGNAKSKE
jgi:hypothetical protein